MKKVHFTENYLLNPHHPVTVFVIGAGGTGSQVITNLARMSMALRALRHPGLHVTVFDPDTVSTANIGRQLFSETELGLNKQRPWSPASTISSAIAGRQKQNAIRMSGRRRKWKRPTCSSPAPTMCVPDWPCGSS